MLTDEEKIQRAKEIYYRRNGISYRGEEKRKRNSPFKMFLIIILIGASVYAYENKEKIFTQETSKEIKDFLNTKIDVNAIFKKQEMKEENKTENETKEEQKEENKIEENQQSESQTEEQQSEPIQNYAVIGPIHGTIPSNLGKRESSDARVVPNHTGIDISGNERW